MKRKIIILTATLLVLAVGLEACAKPHEHLFSEGWSSDESYHWRQPLCGDTDPTKERHSFDGDKCVICGYEREPSAKPDEGEQTPGEQNPGENPGEQTPGENPEEQDPGESENPGENPGESENPGENPEEQDPGEQNPGESENPGENPGGEDEEPDENVDLETLPDQTVKPDRYYTKIEDVFENVAFQDMTGGAVEEDDIGGSAEAIDEAETQSEVDIAWAAITQTLRNVELGKGFAFGDILIDESRHQAFYSAVGIWQFKGLNGSIKNAEKLSMKEVLTTEQAYAPSEISAYYADMHSAYEIIGGQPPKSYQIENAAAYAAQDVFDSFRYHLGEFQYCMGAAEKIKKQYARDGEYYYIQAIRDVEDSSSGIAIPVRTTMQAAYYKGYLVAFRHTMKYLIGGVDMSSDAYILVTKIDESIARPDETYTQASGAPSWVPLPHENLGEKDFSEDGMQKVTNNSEAHDAYNVFANSLSMAGYGFDYIAPRGDVRLKTKNAYSESEITFDKYSAEKYLIHKTTKGKDFESENEEDTIDCEQYLDSEHVYERRKRGTETDGKIEEKKYLNEGYSDFYSYVLTYDITENIMTLLSSYCEAISEHLGYDGSGSYLPAKNFELYKKVSGEYTVYLIKFSNKNTKDESEANSTEFSVYYAFDSAGALCGEAPN